MSESSDSLPSPAPAARAPVAPPGRLIERKVALDGGVKEFPLERWLVSPEVIVGRWVADADPLAMARYPGASGFTSWGVWWPQLPYGAYRLHRPDGSLRVYRLDVIDRVICDGESVEFHDLLLDAIIFPDGEVRIEDEDEVEAALEDGLLTLDQRWRIDWVRHMFESRAELLMARIDRAIERAIAQSGRSPGK